MRRYNVTFSDEVNDYLLKICGLMTSHDVAPWSMSSVIEFCVRHLKSDNFYEYLLSTVKDVQDYGKRD